MVDEGFVTPEQLALALAEQKRTGRPLGAIFVELGFVSAGAVANALAEQHGGMLKTEFGVSAGLYALPGGATRQAAAAAAMDPVAAQKHDLETQLQAVLTERNAFAQRVNEQAARLSESAQAHDAEVARVTDAAAAHIAKLDALISELRGEVAELREQAEQRQNDSSAEAEAQSALADRDELISQLQRELAELREQAEQRPDDQAHETEIASVNDAAAARIATVEAEAQSALASRDELISQLQHEVAELQKEQPRQDDVSAEETAAVAAVEAEMQTALAGRDELISQLQHELAELREQASSDQTTRRTTTDECSRPPASPTSKPRRSRRSRVATS